MLENTGARFALAGLALVAFIAVVGLVAYLLNGGTDSFWSYFSWLDIRNSSANI